MNGIESLDITRVLIASGLAIASMIAMIIGAFVGLYLRPSQRLSAIIMAFGTGALIQALAIELALKGAHRLVDTNVYSGIDAWMWVSSGFVTGGLIYYLVNKWLDQKGAAIRHPALAKFYYLKKKQEESKEILNRLSNVDIVRSLPPPKKWKAS